MQRFGVRLSVANDRVGLEGLVGKEIPPKQPTSL